MVIFDQEEKLDDGVSIKLVVENYSANSCSLA